MLVFFAQETYFAGTDVVGQAYHGTDIVGRHQVVGDDNRVGNPLKKVFGRNFSEQVVGFQIGHNMSSAVNLRCRAGTSFLR